MALSLRMFEKLFNGIFRVLLLIIFTTSPLTASNKTDSLLNELNKVDKQSLPSLYMELFVAALNDHDSAYSFAESAIASALAVGDSLNYVRGEYALGYLLKRIGNYEEAVVHYRNALNTARNNEFTDREKAILNGLALSYYSMSRFDVSLRYHFQSLELREKEGDEIEIAIASNNIGLIYYHLRDFEKAIVYFQRALNIEESNNYDDVEGTYVNLGLAYIGIGKYEEALTLFDKAIERCAEQCDPTVLKEAYDGRGHCLYNKKDYEGAKRDYFKALSFARTNNLDNQLPSIYNGLAKVFASLNNLNYAKLYLDSSLNVSLELAVPNDIQENYKDYANVAYKQNDFKTAYEYQTLYDSVSNSIMNEVLAKNLLQIQVDFQERENLELIAIKNKEISRTNTLLILMVIIAALTAFIVLLFYKANVQRKKVNEKLHLANDTIEEKNKELIDLNSELEERVKERTEELRESNAALIKSNHDLDNFIYKTSHDIRGPLATLQGVCNVALMDIKDPVSVDYFQKLGKTAKKLNQILSKLLVINQINNTLPTDENVNVTELIDDFVEIQKIDYLGKSIDVEVPSEAVSIQSDKELIKVILGNLINNAFKFHNPSTDINSFIKVTTEYKGDELIMEVIDNGVGISANIAHQIFDIFSKTTELHDTAGMGLYLAKLAVDKLSGTIEVGQTEDGNTLFRVAIPTK